MFRSHRVPSNPARGAKEKLRADDGSRRSTQEVEASKAERMAWKELIIEPSMAGVAPEAAESTAHGISQTRAGEWREASRRQMAEREIYRQDLPP